MKKIMGSLLITVAGVGAFSSISFAEEIESKVVAELEISGYELEVKDVNLGEVDLRKGLTTIVEDNLVTISGYNDYRDGYYELSVKKVEEKNSMNMRLGLSKSNYDVTKPKKWLSGESEVVWNKISGEGQSSLGEFGVEKNEKTQNGEYVATLLWTLSPSV